MKSEYHTSTGHNITIGDLLSDDIRNDIVTAEVKSRKVAGLSLNHRDVQDDWVFVALKGGKEHGLNYLSQVAQHKPAAILLDETEYDLANEFDIHQQGASTTLYYKDTPVIMVNNLRGSLDSLGKRFYDQQDLQWLGVTGTNGKSSIAHMLGQSLNNLGHKAAVVGGVYNGFSNTRNEEASLTTPDILTLMRYGSDFKRQGAEYVALECSSHALSQHRTKGLNLVCGVFTNLSMDHADYHKSIEDYEMSKYRLFEYPSLEYAVINCADPVGAKWYKKLRTEKKCLSYGNHQADIFAEDVVTYDKNSDSGSFTVHSPQGKGVLNIRTCSSWGVDNALATLGVLLHLDVKLADALSAIADVEPLSGRMERISFADNADFIIDYAHSPDALLRTLQSARSQMDKDGKLWVVFGCGGNRDPSKRAVMGKIADKHADKLVLTNDNPRYEDPMGIIKEIMLGINTSDPVIIHDRGDALEYAFTNAKREDLVVVAGKGHESYQETMGEKRAFNDHTFITNTGINSR